MKKRIVKKLAKAKKTKKQEKKIAGKIQKKTERKVARKIRPKMTKREKKEIEQEAREIVEGQAQRAFAPREEGGRDEAEQKIEEGLGERGAQGKLPEYAKEEDENKLFLDISSETEKGEPESNLEALVSSRRQLPDNIKEARVIEAALFMSSKPLAAQELAKLTGIAAIGYVENEIRNLQGEYEQKGSAIAIACEDGKYLMRLKPEYLKFVGEFAQQGELSRTALKVLAYIAKGEGILKSTLVKRIGASVYDGVAELTEKGFLEQRKSGRSSSLRTTQKFREYFSQ